MTTELDAEQQRILDLASELVCTTDFGGASGRKLRSKLSGLGIEHFAATVKTLVPSLLQSQGLLPDDRYRPTLAGLILSSKRESAMSLGTKMLAYLRDRFEGDPDFPEFHWDEIKSALEITDGEFPLLRLLLELTQMNSGYGGADQVHPIQFHWRTPRDIERFLGFPDFKVLAEACVDAEAKVRRNNSVSIKDDAGKILHALASFQAREEDPRRGRHNLTGQGLTNAVRARWNEELDPNRINDAVALLADNGLVAVHRASGTAPFSFRGVEVTPQGRIRIEEASSVSTRTKPVEGPDPRKVFVIHGRDEQKRVAMFTFLRALALEPIEWSHARAMTGKGSPYIGEILDAAFGRAQAVVALLTGDDEARLRSELAGDAEEEQLTPQARPNVLFEAGMAMGSHADRTVFVEIGSLRPFSDIAGRHTIRFGKASGNLAGRQELATRLRDAGCAVNLDGTDWHSAGDL